MDKQAPTPSDETPTVIQRPRSTIQGLTRSAASGAIYLGAQAVAGRLVGLLGQLALTALFIPADFGIVTTANIVFAVCGLIVNLGFDAFLVQRGRAYRPWMNPLFWCSAVTGTIGAVLICLLAVPTAWLYETPVLEKMLYFGAATTFIAALQIVPIALLNSRLQFRKLAMLGLLNGVLVVISAVVLAWMGWGPLSIIMANPFITAFMLVLYWRASGIKVRRSWQLGRLRFAVRPLGWISAGRVGPLVISQGDYFLMSRLSTTHFLGLYSWAFAFASVFPRTLSNQLATISVPILTQIDGDRDRQNQAILRSIRLIGTVSWFAIFMQTILGAFVLRWAFETKYEGGLLPFQLLSIGFGFEALTGLVVGLMLARGLNSLIVRMTIMLLPMFFILAGVGAYLGAAVGCAAGVCLYFLIVQTGAYVLVLSQQCGLSKFRIAKALCVPAFALLPAFLIAESMPYFLEGQHRSLILVFMTVLYLTLAWASIAFLTPGNYAIVRETAAPIIQRIAGMMRSKA